MVFACLILSVFATIDAYEAEAARILFHMVSTHAAAGLHALPAQSLLSARH